VKIGRMNILDAAVITAIAIGSFGFIGGCKSREILKDRPFIPPPSNQEPSDAPLAAPVIATPIVIKPVLPPAPVPLEAKPAPAPVETVVPK
jgi:hypothetical protein